jgi:hypothetical protein
MNTMLPSISKLIEKNQIQPLQSDSGIPLHQCPTTTTISPSDSFSQSQEEFRLGQTSPIPLIEPAHLSIDNMSHSGQGQSDISLLGQLTSTPSLPTPIPIQSSSTIDSPVIHLSQQQINDAIGHSQT